MLFSSERRRLLADCRFYLDASASKAGYPSAFVIESEFKYSDKRIHTTADTIDKLDFDHMLQHAKLTLGTAYELAFANFEHPPKHRATEVKL